MVPGWTFAQPLEVIAWRTTFSFGFARTSGDVESSGHLDVHPGGDVGLRVEVDDESPDASGESR